MSTVIYLANQQIQVITGTPGNRKISVAQCYTEDAPDGCIINGMIMDTDAFVSFMQNFWKTHNLPAKDVILVINSTKFIGKNIEMPLLNLKKTEEFINREFTDIKQGEDYICGYLPISQNKTTKKIYAEIITTDFVKDYMDIFAEIGVKVKAVYSGESSLIRLTALTAAQQYKTFVLQIADRMTITTILWVNGEFYYFNSARCFHDQGTEDYAQDIARSVSQIRQFMQANQLDYPIEAVLLAGVNPQDLPLYQNAISQLEIYARVEVFADAHITSAGVDVQTHFHAISGLVTAAGKNGRQNFLEGYQSGKKKETDGGGVGKGFLAILISLAVMLVGLAICITVRTLKKQELSKLKEYNESPATIMDVARYDVLLSQTSYLNNQYNAIAGVNKNLYTYPVCNEEIMDIVNRCAKGYATVTFESFDADTGSLAMTARSDTVDNINVFIRNLCNEDIFNDVDYTGYSFVESDNLWDIHVTCTLAESAGRHTDTDAQPAEETMPEEETAPAGETAPEEETVPAGETAPEADEIGLRPDGGTRVSEAQAGIGTRVSDVQTGGGTWLADVRTGDGKWLADVRTGSTGLPDAYGTSIEQEGLA